MKEANITLCKTMDKMKNKKLILIFSAFFLLTIIPLVSSTELWISSMDRDGEGNSYPLDKFTIEIRDNSILRNVTINYCFYDSDEDECLFEETEFIPRIDEEYNWEIKIDKNLSELETKEYEINATINGTRNGKFFGISRFEEIRMLIEEDLVIMNNLTETDDGDDYSVDDSISFNSEIWNIGKNDQANVYMNIYSDDLNLNETRSLGNISSMNKVNFNYILNIPDYINFYGEEYLCPKVFFTLYNSSGIEFNKSDGEIIEERRNFCIRNPDYDNSDGPYPSARINYQIVGKPEIGKETTIEFNITNNGEIPINGTIKIPDYNWEEQFTDWAVLQSISPSTFNLNPNQSMQVELKLIPNEYGIHQLEIVLYDLNNTNFMGKGVNIVIYDTATNQTVVINNTIDSTEEINSLNEKISNLEDEINSLDKKQTKKIKKLQQEIDELNEIINSLNNPEVLPSQPSTPTPIILNSSQEEITFLERIINFLKSLFDQTQ